MEKQAGIAVPVARQFAVWLLLCALLLRALIPAGFMPNLNPADGQGLLVICSGNGASLLLPDAGDTQAPADTHQDGLCAFAMIGGWAPVLAMVLVLLWQVPRAARPVVAPARPAIRQILCAPLGARAPPHFA